MEDKKPKSSGVQAPARKLPVPRASPDSLPGLLPEAGLAWMQGWPPGRGSPGRPTWHEGLSLRLVGSGCTRKGGEGACDEAEEPPFVHKGHPVHHRGPAPFHMPFGVSMGNPAFWGLWPSALPSTVPLSSSGAQTLQGLLCLQNPTRLGPCRSESRSALVGLALTWACDPTPAPEL